MKLIKLALLGHGPFAEPSFKILTQNYEIVDQSIADCLIVANYGKILSHEELAKPKFGAINLHGSLLPKYRGPSPVQTALANGDKQTGVTVIVMDEQIDHGPILATANMPIGPDDTTESLKSELGDTAAKIIQPTLEKYFLGYLKPVPQDHNLATFTKKINFSDGLIDPTNANNQINYNKYRAYKDEPGVYVQLNDGQILKIIEAKLVNDKFIPITVQKSGKKRISYNDFLKGYRGQAPFKL